MVWLRRLYNALWPGTLHRDIDRETAFHLAERADDLQAAGLTPNDAQRQARRRFGNVTLQTERTRDVNVSWWLDASIRSLRYAIRSLARTPAFTVAVVLTLALGIGANSLVFSALDAVLLRPLPYPDADRLVQLSQWRDGGRSADTFIAPARLEDWERLNTTFESLTGYYVEDVSETSGELPERVRRASVAPRFFVVWAVTPAIGRDFAMDEYHFGGPPAAVISDRFWRRRFAANPDVIGRTLRIGTQAVPIVGVMPATFLFADRSVDVWSPVQTDAPYAQPRQNTWYTGIGRLKPGVSLEQARANLDAVQQSLADLYPATDAGLHVTMDALKRTTIADVQPSLWLLFGAVSVLLLITISNVASLLVARAAARRHEMAVRVSLGATRTAVAAQVLLETGVLAAVGAAAGLGLAYALMPTLRAIAGDLPRMDEVALDGRILGYTALVTSAVTLLCGWLPAVRSARGSPGPSLGRAGRGEVASRHHLQWWLVGTQVALSVTLLAGAGLLVRSAWAISRVDPGFNPSHILAFRVSGTYAETTDFERLLRRVDGTLEALRALPGVESAATASSLPGVPTEYDVTFEPSGNQDADARPMVATSRVVSPEYFATLGIPLVTGEPCARRPSGMADVMVNRAFVARYLADRLAVVGLELAVAGENRPAHRIVGVVGDARERGIDREPAPTVYSCTSAGIPTPYFLVRTRGEPQALVSTIRVKMKALEPLRSVYEIETLPDRIGDAFAEDRLRLLVLGCFAGAALLLTCVGLYGTLSYVASLRRREVGLRMALGAKRGEIVGRFLLQALRVAAGAIVAGLTLSLGGSRLLRDMLYGVTPSDPVTLVIVGSVVLIVAALAGIIPAVRAARIDPMRVLRDE